MHYKVSVYLAVTVSVMPPRLLRSRPVGNSGSTQTHRPGVHEESRLPRESSRGLMPRTFTYKVAGTCRVRADVYSLGAILYECLTGRRAFPSHDLLEAVRSVLRDEPPPVRPVRPDAPKELVAVTERCPHTAPDRLSNSFTRASSTDCIPYSDPADRQSDSHRNEGTRTGSTGEHRSAGNQFNKS